MGHDYLLQENGDRIDLEDGSGDSLILDQGASADVHAGGSGGWLDGKPEVIVPWKQRIDKPRQLFELVVHATPIIKITSEFSIKAVPHLVQNVRKEWMTLWIRSVITKPLKSRGLRAEAVIHKLSPLDNMLSGITIKSALKERHILYNPVMGTTFSRKLIGKALHGINIISMGLGMSEVQDKQFESFTVDEPAREWEGTQQYTDAVAKILTFSHSSSFVGQVVYEKATKEMLIVLGDSTYNFCKVPRAIYDGFRKAGSKGKYFNEVIKGAWDC